MMYLAAAVILFIAAVATRKPERRGLYILSRICGWGCGFALGTALLHSHF